MPINLTEQAADEVKRIISSQEMEAEGTYLRVQVAAGGCSGFQYRLGLEEKDKFDDTRDELVEQNGVQVAIDRQSMLYLDGTTIDYKDGIDQRGFSFDNPNVVKSCGCGSSFQA